MGIARQLYQLQEIDLEIESADQARSQITSQLGESEAVGRAQERLQSERQRLDELKRKQQALEWEIDDVSEKLATAEDSLFSGRIKNPKELTNLQQEVEMLKSKRNQREEKALETMDEVDQAEASIAKAAKELEELQTKWRLQQQQLSADLARVEATLSELNRERHLLADEIYPQAVELYQLLRRGKSLAVVRVEQGVCRGCRISLPVSELQRVKGGDLVRCGSCGRILFLA